MRLVICRLGEFWNSLQIPKAWGLGFLAFCKLPISLYKGEKKQVERGSFLSSVLCQPTLLLEVSLISLFISEPMLWLSGSMPVDFLMVLLWLTMVV